jgi:hypothetical protein
MPWPTDVLDAFQAIPPEPSESDYYGPYNTVLHTLFPRGGSFIIAPQWMSNSRSAADFVVNLKFQSRSAPILFLELKTSSNLDQKSSRERADTQMRKRFAELAGEYPVLCVRMM